MKKIISIILAVIMILSLTACGGGGGSKQPASSSKVYTLEDGDLTYQLDIGEGLKTLKVKKNYGAYTMVKIYTMTIDGLSDSGATISALNFNRVEYEGEAPKDANMQPELMSNQFKGLNKTLAAPVAVSFNGSNFTITGDTILLDPTNTHWEPVHFYVRDLSHEKWAPRDYSDVPDLMTFFDGTKVETVADFERRQEEIVAWFENNVYGFMPKDGYTTSYSVEKEEDALDGKATKRTVKMIITTGKGTNESTFDLYLPKNKTNVPLIFGLGAGSFASQIIERGYAVASFDPAAYSPDTKKDYATKLISIFDNDQFRTLGAWAFGLLRGLDYLYELPEIDNQKIAIYGMSRNGKAGNWAAANDDRISVIYSCQSGCLGDTLARHMPSDGETLHGIANDEFGMPYWVCDNFYQYMNNEDNYPVDQHMLLASLAPRKLYVSTAELDKSSDPWGELNCLLLARPGWEIFGMEVIEDRDSIPEFWTQLSSESMGFHTKYSAHSIVAQDFELFLDFCKNEAGW